MARKQNGQIYKEFYEFAGARAMIWHVYRTEFAHVPLHARVNSSTLEREIKRLQNEATGQTKIEPAGAILVKDLSPICRDFSPTRALFRINSTDKGSIHKFSQNPPNHDLC